MADCKKYFFLYRRERSGSPPRHARGSRQSRLLVNTTAFCLFLVCVSVLLFPLRAAASEVNCYLVPERAYIPPEEAREAGRKMLRWMRDNGWIEKTSRGKTYDGEGYAFTDAAEALVTPRDRPRLFPARSTVYNLPGGPHITFAFSVVSDGKEVFHPMEGAGETVAHCPACKKELELGTFGDMINVWFTSDNNPPVPCPLCGAEHDINAYRLDPQWGFSTLGFGFFDIYELSPEFIAAFGAELGEPVRLVSVSR